MLEIYFSIGRNCYAIRGEKEECLKHKDFLKSYGRFSPVEKAWLSKTKGDKKHCMFMRYARENGFKLCEAEHKSDSLTAEEKQERNENRAYAMIAKAKSLKSQAENQKDLAYWTQPINDSTRGRAFHNGRLRVLGNYRKGLDLESRASEILERKNKPAPMRIVFKNSRGDVKTNKIYMWVFLWWGGCCIGSRHGKWSEEAETRWSEFFKMVAKKRKSYDHFEKELKELSELFNER